MVDEPVLHPTAQQSVNGDRPGLTDTAPPPDATPSPGGGATRIAGARPVSDHELIACVGRGGFGEVWKARGPSNFTVALKFIRLGNNAGEVELHSLDLMRNIRHAHVLSLFGAWQRDG